MRIRKRILIFGLLATVLWSCTAGVSKVMACSPLPPASSPHFLEHLTSFLNDLCYQKENWQHDAHVRTSDGVHPFVRVWYSPGLFDWMTVKDRKGLVPNGAIVVKEMYVSLTAPLTEWTVMPSFYTGQFAVGPPDQLYGPYLSSDIIDDAGTHFIRTSPVKRHQFVCATFEWFISKFFRPRCTTGANSRCACRRASYDLLSEHSTLLPAPKIGSRSRSRHSTADQVHQ